MGLVASESVVHDAKTPHVWAPTAPAHTRDDHPGALPRSTTSSSAERSTHTASWGRDSSCMQTGKPRPNFLQVCKPSLSAAEALSERGATSGPATATAGSITADDCTDGRDMADYLRSFPSGHASAAIFLGMYPVIYLLYSLLVRREVGRGAGMPSRLMWDARMALMTCGNGLVFALVRPVPHRTHAGQSRQRLASRLWRMNVDSPPPPPRTLHLPGDDQRIPPTVCGRGRSV